MGATVLACETSIATWTASSRLVLIYDSKSNTISMSQVSVIPLLEPVIPNIPKGRVAHQTICRNSILEELGDRPLECGSGYEFESKRQHSEDFLLQKMS